MTGTLGVLRAGAEQGLVNVPDLLERLKATNFYLDETLLNAVFDRWLEPQHEVHSRECNGLPRGSPTSLEYVELKCECVTSLNRRNQRHGPRRTAISSCAFLPRMWARNWTPCSTRS